MDIPTIKVTFDRPQHGWWDGGAKTGGNFTPERYDGRNFASPMVYIDKDTPHPGPHYLIRWGCFYLNFWFLCGSGRTWTEATSIAKRWMERRIKVPATVEVMEVTNEV